MALTYGLALNMAMVNSIQNQCTLTNYSVSVERLNQYMNIPSEAPEIIKDKCPPQNWPSIGKVEICNLQVSLLFIQIDILSKKGKILRISVCITDKI